MTICRNTGLPLIDDTPSVGARSDLTFMGIPMRSSSVGKNHRQIDIEKHLQKRSDVLIEGSIWKSIDNMLSLH